MHHWHTGTNGSGCTLALPLAKIQPWMSWVVRAAAYLVSCLRSYRACVLSKRGSSSWACVWCFTAGTHFSTHEAGWCVLVPICCGHSQRYQGRALQSFAQYVCMLLYPFDLPEGRLQQLGFQWTAGFNTHCWIQNALLYVGCQQCVLIARNMY